ncbi:stage III sporulation protein AB [Gottschalkia purinilytica]|uniref:Stage III sporulation protein AB n=1 Tax=Gottschalkia purinilytica TaxID=1503 RepID=A0A0L0W7F4_GOTPU|nr:stage III sporulation protein SpoIIIAB [Gottschalkia purinilytica]KNF07392.1 stage III sporulation protein AB [Gottschalkia purinilytica]
MLLVKIIGCLLTLSSCSLLGFNYSKRYANRLNNLVFIQNCIQLLETEIIYSANPIPEALENTYKKGNKKVSFIFKDIKDHLISNKNISLYESFKYNFYLSKDKLYLEEEDIEMMLLFGRNLGLSDRMDQQKHFKSILMNLKTQQDDAEDKKNRNAKMYKNLGVLLGLALVLILY